MFAVDKRPSVDSQRRLSGPLTILRVEGNASLSAERSFLTVNVCDSRTVLETGGLLQLLIFEWKTSALLLCALHVAVVLVLEQELVFQRSQTLRNLALCNKTFATKNLSSNLVVASARCIFLLKARQPEPYGGQIPFLTCKYIY